MVETPTGILRKRRGAARAALGGGVLVLPAAPVQMKSRDGERPYHPDRDLLYLTGATEPGTVAVLTGGDEPGLHLFVRERDADAELWSGPRLGPEGASERCQPDACHALGELPTRLPELLRAADRIFFRLGSDEVIERHVRDALAWARGRGARTGTGPRAVVDPGEILDDLRLLKDEHELALLRRAAEVTVEGHRAAAARIAPGEGEWTVEAVLHATFRASGGGGPGYESIVGSGANACVLHYVDNASVIAADALVLVDAGAEYGFYNGDVTRTYPASGRLEGAQREIYEIVEAARAAAVTAVKPGCPVASVHDTATRVLVEGLVALGVLSGDPAELIAADAHKPFYPHQTSHWLGLDVHDPGDFARRGVSRSLEPGMVLTVEPGLYFRPSHEKTPARFAGIGVRLEDDVVVTEDGHEVLTASLPTAADDVAALVGSAR
ncbi:MAG: aminopeptidase P N-terminal domain-containing protein [Gemmatimonadales bacterium]